MTRMMGNPRIFQDAEVTARFTACAAVLPEIPVPTDSAGVMEEDKMAQFRPFEMEGMPIEEQPMNWKDMVPMPYDKKAVDAYTRTRIILMNGIENNAVLTSHAIERMHPDPEVKKSMALMRRIDSQQQELVNWLNPADQSIIETTLGYEQVAVDLTANLAQNEPDPYVKQTLDFALLEDFDHLYRYSCLYDYIEGGDPEVIVQGKTEVKPGRPTSIEHRHPFDSMRKHYDKDTADIKTKMNYITITAAEQQTMLYYRSHGFMYPDDIARQLYAEIAEIEEQHVTQYGLLGDPNETMLEKMAMMELNEAYLYHSCAETESDPRIKGIWEMFAKMEVAHFNECARLIKKIEGRDIQDLVKADVIEPLVVFEQNKDYVNSVIDAQLDLAPNNMEFVRMRDLPDDWASFGYLRVMNAKGVPSEEIVSKAGPNLAERDQMENIRRVKQEMARRVEKGMAAVPAR
jgi:rubrerythrin